MTSTTARDAGPRRAVAGQSDVNTLAPFRSVLFPGGAPEPTVGEPAGQPEYFGDLNLDQVEDALTRGRDQYELEPFFRQPLTDIAIVRYRQDVFRDLDRDEVRSQLTGFAEHMASVCKIRTYAATLRDRQPSRRWLLNAVDEYCRAVVDLQQGLRDVEPRSAGLVGLANYLGDHVAGQAFRALRRESRDLLDQFERLRFALLIRGGKLTVARYDGEPDYCAQVLATFERFRQGDVKDHRARLGSDPFMSHVEVAILDLVAQLFPELFAQLGEFCASHADFVDPTVARADRELQFYLGYHAYTAPLRRAGLRFSYPEVSTTAKRVAAEDTFDIALADKLVTEQAEVITNDFRLDGDERILVVSGPNQGGKTTLARTFGQLCHLAALGCPVPGSATQLVLPDRVFTHFEREEDIENLAGGLENELNRMRAILDAATANSVLVLNEMFNSTTVQDAAELSRRVLTRVSELDALCLCVTFIDELSVLNDKTVSMVSTVDPADPAVRTFKLVRKPADGRAYAMAIADKYDLTYDTLTRRLT